MAIFGFGKKEEAKTTEGGSPDTSAEVFKEKVVESKKETVVKSEVVKTNTTPTPPKKKGVGVQTTNVGKTSATDLTGVIIRPRITEKASILVEEGNVYTFDVLPGSTKSEVAKAVENHYKVRPMKVNITDIKAKRVFRRGKRGTKAGGRKAMVYLKKGDKIEFV